MARKLSILNDKGINNRKGSKGVAKDKGAHADRGDIKVDRKLVVGNHPILLICLII